MLQVVILRWKRWMAGRWWLLPATIFTVVGRVVHAIFKQQNQAVESVQSKTSRPLSKKRREICDAWIAPSLVVPRFVWISSKLAYSVRGQQTKSIEVVGFDGRTVGYDVLVRPRSAIQRWMLLKLKMMVQQTDYHRAPPCVENKAWLYRERTKSFPNFFQRRLQHGKDCRGPVLKRHQRICYTSLFLMD